MLTEKLSDCLIIADRGYVSFELKKKIAESGNRFIIKGKSNSAGNIKAAFDSNSNALPELTGTNLKDAEIAERMDFDIVSERRMSVPGGEDKKHNETYAEMHECRVVREPHACRDGDERVITENQSSEKLGNF